MFTVDESNKNLIICCCQSFSKNIDRECRILPGEGLIGWVFREQKPVVASNFDRKTKTLMFYSADEEIKSLMAVPLPEKKGVLFVDSKKSYCFAEQKEKIFNQLAATAVSLCNADIEKEERDLLKKLLFFNQELDEQLYVLRKEKKKIEGCFHHILTTFTLSSLFLAIPEKETYCHYLKNNTRCFLNEYEKKHFSSDGLLGWVIRNKKNLFMENLVERDKKSFVFNKEEYIDNFNNFLGVHFTAGEKNIEGGIGFVKEKGKKWNKAEVDCLEKSVKKLFSAWVA